MIPETMVPGSFNDFNYYAGPNGLPSNVQKVLLVGAGLSSGAIAVNTPTDVTAEAEVIAGFGAGSIVHRMYLVAKAAWKYAKITAVRHAEPVDGTAGTWTLTFATTATKSGQIDFQIGKDLVSIGVAVGATPAAKATSMAAAINAKTQLPGTATVAEGVLTFTLKNTGKYVSDGMTLKASTTDTDMTATLAVDDAGTGTVDITTTLAACFGARYHLICIDQNDATNMAVLKTHMNNAGDAITQRGQRGIAGFKGDKATVTALGLGLNAERMHIGTVKAGYLGTPWEIAASMGAIFASVSKPNIPMNFKAIPGMPVPDVQDLWSDEAGGDMDVLLEAGIIPLAAQGTQLVIVRAVTTRTSNNGVRFEKLVDTGTVASFDYYRDCIHLRDIEKFSESVLWVHGDSSMALSIADEHYLVAKELEVDDICRNVDDYADGFQCVESTVKPGRTIGRSPAPVVPGLIQIMTTIDCYV